MHRVPFSQSSIRNCLTALLLTATAIPASLSTVQAAPTDLLSANGDVGVYLKDFPAGIIETSVNLNAAAHDVGTTSGAAGGVTVVFFSPSGSFDAASGVANITGVGGNSTFPDLRVSTPGSTFTDIVFGAQTPTANLTVQAFSGNTSLGSYTFTGAEGYKANAKNDILVLAEGNSVITSILLSSSGEINQVKDVNLSGLAASSDDAPGPAPLPGALVLMSTVLAGGLGMGAYRRRRKPAA
jgi:hypothetical protein